jgi:hypothetical protein
MNAILRNISYNNPEIRDEVNNLVGKSYSLYQRFRLKGTGSPKFLIRNASQDIMDKLNLDSNLNYISIEIRPAGIIVFFRSLLETFGWILPFKAYLFSRDNGIYKIEAGEEFVSFDNSLKFNSAENFLDKMAEQQKIFNH